MPDVNSVGQQIHYMLYFYRTLCEFHMKCRPNQNEPNTFYGQKGCQTLHGLARVSVPQHINRPFSSKATPNIKYLFTQITFYSPHLPNNIPQLAYIIGTI